MMPASDSAELKECLGDGRNKVCRMDQLFAAPWQVKDIQDEMARLAIPGVSLALVEGGKLAWVEAKGVRKAGSSEPVTAETLFQAASISKPVATLTALSLVQEGRITLDEDIRPHQHSWQTPAVDGWQPCITLRQLLTHTAGFNIEGIPGYPAGSPLPTLVESLTGVPPCNTPPVMVDTLPGHHYRYSGGGFIVLQQLLEDLTGQPFWQLARDRVLVPAGMDHSTYECPLPARWQANAACGHRADGEPLAGGWHEYPEAPVAGLWTTPGDLARLLILLDDTLAGRSETIVAQKWVQEMFTPQAKLRELGLEGDTGLSLFLTGEPDDLYCGHGGSNEGFRCEMLLRKGRGQALVIMTNSENGSTLNDMWTNTIAICHDWDSFADLPMKTAGMDPDALALLPGCYHLENGRQMQVRLSAGGLELLPEGQPAMKTICLDENFFYMRQINASLRFKVADGRCTGLIFRQNGEPMEAERQ